MQFSFKYLEDFKLALWYKAANTIIVVCGRFYVENISEQLGVTHSTTSNTTHLEVDEISDLQKEYVDF
jgi:hypothetical protein